ncbi:MAG: hypothetical protein NBV76_01735 [Candidatus Ochrobactrum gambitense]|nr:MAG: hypothetical protein NBV76_01735 [Candidatus Ochrobactrum gambitense]WEK15678.1 MAG: hypothetical protein P0Y54_09225 [Candidatus Ochrobactrum gambitense]
MRDAFRVFELVMARIIAGLAIDALKDDLKKPWLFFNDLGQVVGANAKTSFPEHGVRGCTRTVRLVEGQMVCATQQHFRRCKAAFREAFFYPALKLFWKKHSAMVLIDIRCGSKRLASKRSKSDAPPVTIDRPIEQFENMKSEIAGSLLAECISTHMNKILPLFPLFGDLSALT